MLYTECMRRGLCASHPVYETWPQSFRPGEGGVASLPHRRGCSLSLLIYFFFFHLHNTKSHWPTINQLLLMALSCIHMYTSPHLTHLPPVPGKRQHSCQVLYFQFSSLERKASHGGISGSGKKNRSEIMRQTKRCS